MQNESSFLYGDNVAKIHGYSIVEIDRHIFGKEAPGKCWFYVMTLELMDYSLNDFVEKIRNKTCLTIEAIQKIAIQLTFGHNSIHKTGVCHNDLKPHNIMVNEIRDKDGKVIKHHLQIIDFGLITSFIENGKHITPEQGKLWEEPRIISQEELIIMRL